MCGLVVAASRGVHPTCRPGDRAAQSVAVPPPPPPGREPSVNSPPGLPSLEDVCGKQVRTLTNAASRDDPFEGAVDVHRLNFEDYESLVESLRGADVLYNTYWVRYNDNQRNFDHGIAVQNCKKLFDAATEAGVRRVVHFSVAKPDQAPGWTYFAGKVETERLLRESGQSYAIVRPTVFFGGGRNVLINNIAWIMRKFPIFGVFGFGKYPIQPVHIRDVARVSIELGSSDENITRDIAGPERFTYRAVSYTHLTLPTTPYV